MTFAQKFNYTPFIYTGLSGGSCEPFTARDEPYFFGVRLGWWPVQSSDYVIWQPITVRFAAEQSIYDAILN